MKEDKIPASPSSSSINFFVNLYKKAGKAAMAKKAKDYFKGMKGRELLTALSDGEFNHELCHKFQNWDRLYALLEGAVEKLALLPIVDRRSLATVLSVAMYNGTKQGKYKMGDEATYTFPKALYALMKIFGAAGGPIMNAPFTEEQLKAWNAFRKKFPDMDPEDANALFRRDWNSLKLTSQ